MLCQNCKLRPAGVHYNVIINGMLSEKHLCTECAVRLGYENADFIGSLLSGFLGEKEAENGTEACPFCGATKNEIIESGKVGCAKCYEIFPDLLSQYIQRIHGNTAHKGKIPAGADTEIKIKREIQGAKEQLKLAVEAQEYERAAVLRDRINALNEEVRRNGLK